MAPGSSNWQAGVREASPYISVGIQMGMAMAFFTGLGWWLDEQFGTSPWLILTGGVLGVLGIFILLFRIVREMNEKTTRERQRRAAKRQE